MSFASMVTQVDAIQQRLFMPAPLTSEESHELTRLFGQIAASNLPEADKTAVCGLQERVAQEPKTEDLQKVSQILVRNCSDEVIAKFLQLDTWQSGGNTAEAKRRIIACFKSQSTRLDLANLGLTSLPSAIGQLTNLKVYFKCCDNQLSSLPKEIGQLINLEDLDCSNNRLTSLPEEIGQLANLEFLHCRNNLLTSLPEGIAQLKKLICLDFTNNHLSSLPASIDQLENLQGLDCSNNQFDSVPMELVRFRETELDFSSNFMTSRLPRGFTRHKITIKNQLSSLDQFRKALFERRQDLKKLEFRKLQKEEESWFAISEWLDKLIDSKDFEQKGIRSATAERVLSILALAEENKEYLASLHAALSEALETCVDRATYYLTALEIQKAIQESKAGTLEEMLPVLRGAFAGQELETFAQELIEKNPELQREELSTRLGLQIELKDVFNLPVGIKDMTYRFCAKLKPNDIAEAANYVQSRLSNSVSLTEFLLGQEVWTKRLEKDFASERAKAVAPVEAESEKLDDQLFAKTLSDEQYLSESKAIQERFHAAAKEWLKAKTEALI